MKTSKFLKPSKKVEPHTITTYKNELETKNIKYNLFVLAIVFVFGFFMSAGNTPLSIAICIILATTLTWRKVDKRFQFDHEGNLVSVDGELVDKYSVGNTHPRQISEDSYEGKLIRAKLLVTHLYNIGQIKGDLPSEEQIEKEFKKLWDKKSSQEK